MSSLSNQLTTEIIHELYRSGAFAWRASSTGIYDKTIGTYRTAPKKGVSDILACFKGHLIAIEVKIGKDRLSPEQTGFLANVMRAGGEAAVVKTFDEFKVWWGKILSTVTAWQIKLIGYTKG